MQEKNLVDLMLEWKKTYGNVISFWLGPIYNVFVLDYDEAVQVYVKDGDAHVGRQNFALFEEMKQGCGVILPEGELWLEHRRFALRTLRDFGLGRNVMQEKILSEYHNRIDPLDAEIEQNGGRLKIQPKEKFLCLLVGSIINRLMVGYSFDESNMEEFLEIRKEFDKLNDAFSIGDMIFLRPELLWIPYLKRRHEAVVKSGDEGVAFALRQIEKRRADIDSGKYHLDETEPNDFIDAFFLEMKRREDSGEEQGTFHHKQLKHLIHDLWQAGMETTILTLEWAFVSLAKNPHVQDKMREEMWNVAGKDRNVEFKDKPFLPYCNAVLTEVHRVTSLLVTNVVRRSVRDCTIGGYHFPKGTDNAVIMSVIFSDDTVFKNPAAFDPERFLGEEGKELERKVIPFGIGKRSCLGEGLARAELFLILLNLVKSYRIIDDGDIPDNWRRGRYSAFAHLTVDYKCVFEKI
ncbi:hypothetical protein L596_013879 [Steinernema carpocapsae]|uniref:Cytochrome P450 n=1 Tax=Steinernema carpocapsae TaxID=34508 RepID=A0A4U5P1G8_STECR|nr:hypothetical protein L596_013879 [Steinernema carpocapsae]